MMRILLAWLAVLVALWWLVVAFVGTMRYLDTSVIWDGEY